MRLKFQISDFEFQPFQAAVKIAASVSASRLSPQ
jgi:hypothetical protein